MKKHFLMKLLSVLLVMATLLTALPISALAESAANPAASGNEVYIKDIKLTQAKSKEEAKVMLEAEGYIFLDANINEGTGADGVWLGYTTTTDPTEAIYDIKLMNSKGGYTLTSMEAMLESQKSTFAQMANDLNDLVEEFVEAYNAGSVAAQKAYKALNFFHVVANESEFSEENGLGYQFVHGMVSIEELTEIILFADAVILDTIVKTLVMGIQLKTGNWMEKLSALGPYDTEKTYGENETEVKRRAKQLLVVFKLYAQTYNAMDAMGLFNENNSGNEGGDMATPEQKEMANLDIARVDLYKAIFDEFAQYSYGEGTLKDFIVSLEKETNEKALYPLVSLLTDGEFSAFSYGCFMEMAMGATTEASDFDGYDESFEEATKDVKPFYIFEGINPVLLKDDTIVAFTDDASRRMALTGEYQFYEKENWYEDFWENRRYDALKIECAGMIVMATAKASLGIMSMTGMIAAAGAKGASTLLVGAVKVVAFLGSATFQLVIFAAALTVALIGYIVYCINAENDSMVDWENYPIPQYIYDIKQVGFASSSKDGITTEYMQRTSYVFYEVVTNFRNNPVDLNAKSSLSSQWIAMYVSHDRPGDDSKPIKAEDFKVVYGNGETPSGYTPMSRFGEVRAYNVNQWDKGDTVNGVYMFFKQDQNITVKSDRTYYIEDVVLQAGESDTHCISLLEAAGFTPLNINLSPDYKNEKFLASEKVYTYLGYKLTDNPDDALTDIRLEYGTGAATKQYGNITYASSGSSAGVTLYATKYDEAGTPILAAGIVCVNDRDEAPAGYEPVNLFAGGPAVSFNTTLQGIRPELKSFYLYFLPEVTFTSGDLYLGGIDYYYCDEDAYDLMRYPNSAGSTGDPAVNAIKDFLKSKVNEEYAFNTVEDERSAMNEYMFLFSGYHSTSAEASNYSNSILYYTTYNPYRAIYDIKGSGIKEISTNVIFDSVGYEKWNTVFWNGTFHASMGYTWTDLSLCYNGQGATTPLNMSTNLYVAGNSARENVYDATNQKMTKVQPIKMSEVIVLKQSDDASAVNNEQSPYKAVSNMFTSSTDPISLKQEGASDAHNVYIARATEDKPYISSITAIDVLTIYRALGGYDSGINRNQITDGMLISQLASQGATHFVDFSVSLHNSAYWMSAITGSSVQAFNKLKFGYARTSDEDKALRDIIFYFNGFSTDAPPREIKRGNVAYQLLCEIPYNLTGYEDAPKLGIYLYGTTDSRAGEPIVDITFSNNPFSDNFKAARTQNGRSVWSEMVEYMKKNKNSHFMSGAKTLFEELYDFFGLKQDVVSSRERNNRDMYFYVLFRSEGYNIREEKPYISEIYLVDERVYKDFDNSITRDFKWVLLDNLFDQGADSFADSDPGYPIVFTTCVGFKRTADPSEAVTAVRLMHTNKKGTPAQTIKISDDVMYHLASTNTVNPEPDGEYVYLYYTKSTNKDIGSPISDLICHGYYDWVEVKPSPAYYTTDSAEVLPVMRWDSWQPSIFQGYSQMVYLETVRPFETPMGTYEEPDYGTAKKQTRYTPSGKAEGKYIAALYVMDKNTLRQEKLASGVASDQCTCDKITDQEVFDRLKAMGATTIIQTPINVTGSDYGKNNPNKVFIGYSRTDNIDSAIKSVVLKTDVLSLAEPAESISIKKVNYDIVAEGAKRVTTLPRAINLIGTQDGQDLLAPRIYLYTSTEGKTEPIYDICLDANPIKEGWVTARSENGINPYTDLYEEAKKHATLGAKDDSDYYDEEIVYSDQLYKWMDSVAGMFNPKDNNVSPFYIHCKMYEGSSIEEALPYIGEIYVAEGGSAHEALTKLIAYAPDGFIDYDFNKGTWVGSNYVYVAYKRTASSTDAIKELAIFTEKNPSESKRLTINGTSVRFDLVANVDFNSGAGGDWLYLYATTNSAAGMPIKALRVSNDVVNRVSGGGFTEFTIKRANDSGFTDQDPDLNDGAGGKYIYLVAKRDVNKSDWPSWMFGGALFGEGSLRMVFVLAGIAAIVAVVIYGKKREKEASEGKSST